MSLTKQDISKIAKLARIRIEESEQQFYAEQISGILKWVEQLNDVDTSTTPQMVSVADIELPRRKDEATDGNRQDEVLRNAPGADFGCFSVPKVIE